MAQLNGTLQNAQILATSAMREKQWFTWGPANLATGTTQIFAAADWNEGEPYTRLVEIADLQATQNSKAQIQWTADGGNASDRAQGWTDGMPAGVRILRRRKIAAVNNLMFQLNNTSGAAIANFQFNYSAVIWKLSVLQKVFLGYDLSEEEQGLVDAMPDRPSTLTGRTLDGLGQLQERAALGYPLSWEEQYSRVWAGHRLPDPPGSDPLHLAVAAAGGSSPTTTLNAGPAIYVLDEVALEGANALTAYYDVDGDLNYLQLNGAAFAQASEEPWDPWAVSASTIGIHISGTAAGTYPERHHVSAYARTPLLAAHAGLTAGVPASVRNQVRLGLM